MIEKLKKLNRKFIPISIAKSLENLNKKILYKFGKLDFIIHAKWSDIVGKFFVQHSEPLKISSIYVSTNEIGDKIYDKYLHVNVSPAVAIEFQHFQDKIIEKINSYFGYKAIHGLKIHQHYVNKDHLIKKTKNTNLIKKEKNNKNIRQLTPKLSYKELEESIVNLGISINKEED